MITILDLTIITIGTGIIGDTITSGDGTTIGIIIHIMSKMTFIITTIILVTLAHLLDRMLNRKIDLSLDQDQELSQEFYQNQKKTK